MMFLKNKLATPYKFIFCQVKINEFYKDILLNRLRWVNFYQAYKKLKILQPFYKNSVHDYCS